MAKSRKSLVVLSCLALMMATAFVGTAAAPKAKTAPAGASAPVYIPDAEAILLTESFETAVPPAGWTVTGTHTGTETWHQDSFDPYDGAYYANCNWDPSLIPQDEWLVSPPFDLAAGAGSISLWTLGSVYWCRDTFDNCDLNVYLVVGAPGGGDDILVGNADGAWPDSWIWGQAIFDISGSLPVNASVGLHYSGTDGAQISADLVVLDLSLIHI